MRRLEWAFHVAVFALQCGAVLPLLMRSGSDTTDIGDSNPLNTIVTAIVLIVVLMLALRRASTVLRYAPALGLILGLLALAFVSVLWSDYPSVTIRRAGSLATVSIWAWYLASRYSLKEVVRLAAETLAVLAILSFLIALAIPSFGMDDPLGPDGWRGAFATKNDLGAIMAIGTATFTYLLMQGGQRPVPFLLRLAGFGLCLILLYLSQSRTSWVVGLIAPAICVVNRLMHRRVGVGIIIWTTFILILAPATLLAIQELPALAELLGRDSTLTGRADLWATLPPFISDRPWFGYGYGAFWVATSPRVGFIWGAVGWQPPHSHNGWLDVLLDLGIAGLSLVAIQVLLVLINSIRAVIDGREPDAQFLLLMVFVLLADNLAESNLVRPGYSWAFFVMSVVFLGRIAIARRAAAAERREERRRGRERYGLRPSAAIYR